MKNFLQKYFFYCKTGERPFICSWPDCDRRFLPIGRTIPPQAHPHRREAIRMSRVRAPLHAQRSSHKTSEAPPHWWCNHPGNQTAPWEALHQLWRHQTGWMRTGAGATVPQIVIGLLTSVRSLNFFKIFHFNSKLISDRPYSSLTAFYSSLMKLDLWAKNFKPEGETFAFKPKK